MATPFAIVMTTCGDKANAELIAMRLVEERLSACVQIFPIESVYRWEGAVQRANEWMLFCKIKANDYAKVEEAIRAAHTYSNPEIVEVGIENGAQAYLDWIASITRED
ncbi:MAG TPA: divalent-cation tolerance protein CutA [Methylocella sp.]|jgi:periplasmic divalent cation tolerance protein|nr:divalent-cation tolerance protein CutA [Methylocella sp.]